MTINSNGLDLDEAADYYQIQSINNSLEDISGGFYVIGGVMISSDNIDSKYLLERDGIYITPNGNMINGVLNAGSKITISLSNVSENWVINDVYIRDYARGSTITINRFGFTLNIGTDINPTGQELNNVFLEAIIYVENDVTGERIALGNISMEI